MLTFLTGRLILPRLVMLACVLVLVGIGLAAIYASGHPLEAGSDSSFAEFAPLWKKQAVFAFVGILAFIAVNYLPYRRLGPASYWLYGLILAMLAYLLLDKYFSFIPFVPLRNGTRRWIQIGPLPQFQPSEFCKIVYILALAWYLRYRSNYRSISALIGPFVLTALPMLLIVLEPDLGTVMLMMPVMFVMLFVAGAKVKHLLIMVLLAVIFSPVLWHQMRDYQKMRISSVLLQKKIDGEDSWTRGKIKEHPMLASALGATDSRLDNWDNSYGYQLIRSKLAIASGQAAGQGFRAGPFIKYNFLPYRHNDFIFALIGHQWGFFGCTAVLLLYAVIIICALEIASHNKDTFARFIAVGIAAMFTIQVLINVSMTIGLMPITGLTLPFISYGGSSLVVNFMAVGLLNNVGRFRPFSIAGR